MEFKELLTLKRGTVVFIDDDTIGCVIDTNLIQYPGLLSFFKFTYLTPSGEIGIKVYKIDADFKCEETSHRCYDAIRIMAELRK